MSFVRVRLWLVELRRWLAEGKVVLMGFLVLVAVVLLGCFAWRSETSIRLTGYALQLLGMAFAIRGLLLVRVHFRQPGLTRLFVQWLRRFPKWKRDTTILVGTARITMSGGRPRVEVWYSDDSSLPVEKRLEGIVGNLERLRREQRGYEELVDNLRNDHEEHKKSVIERNENLEKSIRTDVETVHTSDLITSLVGLLWLTVGITMSTLAPELSTWLGG